MSDDAHSQAARDYLRQAGRIDGREPRYPSAAYIKLLSAVVHALLAIASAIRDKA